MAMFVEFDNGKYREYHIGDKLEFSELELSRVAEVKADGHEQEFINNHFINLPSFKMKYQQFWYKEWAQMIVEHWDEIK